MVPYGDARNMMGIGKIMLTFPASFSVKPLRIHGTPERDSIGKRVSGGCVRMYDEDFEDLAGRLEHVSLPINVHYQE